MAVVVAVAVLVGVVESTVALAAGSRMMDECLSTHHQRCPSAQALDWQAFEQYFAFLHRLHLANSRG